MINKKITDQKWEFMEAVGMAMAGNTIPESVLKKESEKFKQKEIKKLLKSNKKNR